MNRIFSVALVYCDKMSTIASLGTKGEIKRQQIKFSDSVIRGNIEANGQPYYLWHFPLQFYLTTMVQEQKLLISLMNNVDGRWLGNIYEHSLLEIP